jgi:hypothetical protein
VASDNSLGESHSEEWARGIASAIIYRAILYHGAGWNVWQSIGIWLMAEDKRQLSLRQFVFFQNFLCMFRTSDHLT